LPDAAHEADKLGVFISYSRRDCLEFAKRLAHALNVLSHRAIIDLQGISGGEAWRPRLHDMILSPKWPCR
jgi:hypothetical protein